MTDTDKATSTALANITVLKIVDYPPEANAGQDVIVYLPRNQLTLSGNLSTDDHAITTWEWTKSPGDADKAVDMQNTRTPYLQLSNLEEGMYTFTLKVSAFFFLQKKRLILNFLKGNGQCKPKQHGRSACLCKTSDKPATGRRRRQQRNDQLAANVGRS